MMMILAINSVKLFVFFFHDFNCTLNFFYRITKFGESFLIYCTALVSAGSIHPAKIQHKLFKYFSGDRIVSFVFPKMEFLPGVLVRKIGGGGKFVPLIGEMQPLSCISCCKMVKYDVNIQNSSNST